MRHNHSADPWSAFLNTPRRRGDGVASGKARGERGEPGEPGARGEGGETGGSDASGGSRPRPEDPDPARGRVLAQLGSGHGPQTFTQICRGTGLGLLAVADAVERLRDDGLVAVERRPGAADGDETVRLVAGPAAG
ncbi:winged helix-turn-helix domain-containing protein [Actinomadura atramentaria]|uniref:winged helix-turn-helix domain-containing protein n=1 Tax=Actinomadura atramentaria TaxID=1990 RepID=UPI00036EE105|nr:winged helix-turn-helix domain-containing protein [Actinomadura atramentaria]